jgi:hypothetical protein
MPSDRDDFKMWKPYVKGLMARNMMQILGKYGAKKVDFVSCWTPSIYYNDSSSGGTGYAIRCAILNKIPIYNLKDLDIFQLTKQYIKEQPDKDYPDYLEMNLK